MFTRRHLSLLAAAACLLLASGAAAAPEDNKFTAVSTPSAAQPAPAVPTYTITLTNDPAPSGEADRATIDPPDGFDVVGTPPPPTVGGCGTVQPWTATVLADETISVLRSGGSANNLCPGGTLTVVFSAAAAVPDGSYQWGVQLRRGEDPIEPPFNLHDAQLGVRVDGTPPDTNVGGPPSPTNQTNATFTFGSTEADSTFECSLDGDAFSGCTSPRSYPSGLSEGEHTFAVRAFDAVGNQDGTPAIHVWTIDTTEPTLQITSAPNALVNSRSGDFEFTASDPTTCKLDTGAPVQCTSPFAYSGLADGSHTFTVTATDLAGNSTQKQHSWTIDATQPTVTLTGPTSLSNDSTPTFTFSADETAQLSCTLDGNAVVPCTSPRTVGPLIDGQHTFSVDANDLAGNTGTKSLTWTIDATAPTITLTGPPALSNDPTPTFEFSADEEVQFSCTRDGVAIAPCASPLTLSALADGAYTFNVQATDTAGNTASRTHPWTLDATAPETTIDSGPVSPTNKTVATFEFHSNETDPKFECRLDSGAFEPCVNPKTYPGLPGGAHTFEVRAIDLAENADPTPASRTWTIDLIGPATIIVTGPPASTNSTSASFTFDSSDPDATYECKLDTPLFTPCAEPAGYTGLVDGVHTFAVRAVDAAQNPGTEATHTWRIDTRPPRAAIAAGPPGLTNNRSATFAFSADEPSSFQCSLDGGGFVPCSSPASYADLVDGAHTFVARPTDAVGNPGASGSYAWTVDGTAPDTTLLAAPRSTTTSIAASFRFSASESAGFQCKLDAGAFAPCSSPKSYARLRRSRHSFQVRAIDPAGNVDPTPAVRRWTIAAATPRTARTASALLAPRAGSRVTSAPLLAWRRVARASFYNVQLYRGRVKVLSAWPTRTRLQLRARWRYLGREHRLSAGTYRWYVWPGFGRASAQRYGRLLGQSTFTITRRR
jgi:hypothetical protein